MSDIKVAYRMRNGHESKAYIDDETGLGSDKHSEAFVALTWLEGPDEWQEGEHECGNDYYMCIDGEIYGPCDSEYCNGACVSDGACSCKCHELIAYAAAFVP